MPQHQKTSTERLIMILIVAVGIVGGYFYYSSVASLSVVKISKPVISKDLEQFKKIKLDMSIFDKMTFKELKIFGESPVRRGDEGKTDLFAPF